MYRTQLSIGNKLKKTVKVLKLLTDLHNICVGVFPTQRIGNLRVCQSINLTIASFGDIVYGYIMEEVSDDGIIVRIAYEKNDVREKELITLVPVGAAKLRITVFPKIHKD